jgi:pilus assembly protein Flp/PilA
MLTEPTTTPTSTTTRPRTRLQLHIAELRKRLAEDESGATAIEYALIASGIGAAIATTVWNFGSHVANFYQSVSDML